MRGPGPMGRTALGQRPISKGFLQSIPGYCPRPPIDQKCAWPRPSSEAVFIRGQKGWTQALSLGGRGVGGLLLGQTGKSVATSNLGADNRK